MSDNIFEETDDDYEESAEFQNSYRSPTHCMCRQELKGILDRIGMIEAGDDHRDLKILDMDIRLSRLEKKIPKM